MSQNNPEMDFNITDLPIPQQFAISNEDIQKIADAGKSKLSEDKIMNADNHHSNIPLFFVLTKSH
jgi:hypothetical protein